MEQHPVPQNVTTFQFRLIGDMTLKQFGYLCAGAILAFIAYKLPMPFIITWPLAGIFAFLGIGFAFIPIEERPMDVWVFSFFKSIYSPTQYIWSHNEPAKPAAAKAPPAAKMPPAAKAAPASTPAPATPQPIAIQSAPQASPAPQMPQQAAPQPPQQTPSKAVLSGLFQQAAPQPPAQPAVVVPPAKHKSLFDELMSVFSPKPKPVPHTVQAPPSPVVPSVTGHHPVTAQPGAPAAIPVPSPQEAVMQQRMRQLEDTVTTLENRLATKSVAEDRVLELQKQLTELLSDKAKTESELVELKRAAVAKPPQPVTQEQAQQPASPAQQEPNRGAVNVITTQEGAVKVGLPRLTSYPNVVTGLVKDDAGNLLPGILVTVTNSDGVPVRALKTNKLGQFAASTQLPNGVYFVEVEDPRSRFTFTRVQITLNGTVVPVLEIIAKSEKALTREKLAQEIFGKTTI